MIAAPIHVPADGRVRVEKLTDVQVLVFDSFALSADDIAIWATHLLTEALTDAGLALKVQQLAMVSAGIPQAQAVVPGAALTTMLQSHAATVAQGISRTYNSALLAFMEKIGAEKPTWNRNQWASALEKWTRLLVEADLDDLRVGAVEQPERGDQGIHPREPGPGQALPGGAADGAVSDLPEPGRPGLDKPAGRPRPGPAAPPELPPFPAHGVPVSSSPPSPLPPPPLPSSPPSPSPPPPLLPPSPPPPPLSDLVPEVVCAP